MSIPFTAEELEEMRKFDAEIDDEFDEAEEFGVLLGLSDDDKWIEQDLRLAVLRDELDNETFAAREKYRKYRLKNRDCLRMQAKSRYYHNRYFERIKFRVYCHRYYLKHRDVLRAKRRKYYYDNIVKMRERSLRHYWANREKYLLSMLAYQKKNPEKKRVSDRAYYLRNRESIEARRKEYQRVWREKNRERINARRRELRWLKRTEAVKIAL